MTSLPPQRERKSQGRRVWVKRATITLPLLCLLIFAAVISVRLINNGQSASAESYTTIKGQVPGLVKTSTLVGPTDASQSLSISVGLQLRNVNNLKSYVDSMTKPKSVNSHKHLTAAQISAAYAPLASSQLSVIDYLQGYGFQVTSTGKQHLVIGFNGTVGDAEKAFQIQINNYTSSKGMSFYAPATDPSVPLNLAGLIQNIAGLDNSTHLSHPPVTRQNLKSNAATANATTACPTATSGQGYIPSQIAAAYNLDSFYSNGFHGEGQTVAVLELDNYQSSDISAYTACFGGSHVPITKISVDGGSSTGAGAIEVELDMELILSAAPNLANLEVYEAPNTANWSQYQDLWNRIINDDSASVISTSWGACEAGVPPANLTAESNLFAIAAAQGQTIFAASGDDGTNDCGFYLPPNGNPQLAVDDPASQPYVTGVGGTRLTLSGNAYGSETTWNDGPITVDTSKDQEVWAGGGGISSEWAMPSWQSGPGVGTSGNREVPDVSLNADPFTGYAMYCSVASACSGFHWLPEGIGGTSAAAPMWAAFMALTNEKTVHEGGFNIGFINPYLYQIDQNAGGTSYSNDFHDVTTGNNDGLGDGGTTYSATVNYDLATGLGSFNAWNLAGDLETLANAKNGTRGAAPANTLWYFAEGAVGGGFEEFITLENPSATTANVTVEYLFTGKAARTFSHPVNPNSRLTVSANTDLQVSPGSATLQSISLVVTSTNDVPIVVERPMYFNFRGVNSGSDVIGTSNVTHTTFYFAQGDASVTSSDSSMEYITVLNPQTTAATITATFYSGGNVVDTKTLTLPSLQRGTMVTSYHHQAAIKVTSDVGVVVERPIYVKANIATAGGATTGAASIIGATAPASDWLFAEGNTGSNFQENLVISNFTANSEQTTVKLMYTNGSTQSIPVTVGPQSQLNFDVNNANKHPQAGCNCTPTNDVAAEVTSADAAIVVERVTFFHYNGESGMTDVLGQAGPASKSVYSFAEGTTVGQFQEFLALSNPTAKAVQVAVTMFVNGAVMEQEVTVPAYTCEEININTIVKPMINAYAPHNADVSMVVQSFGGPVVAERVMYFSFHTQTGGTDIIGYTGD